ncbi:hypothetical protein A9Q84_16180 [Halobacteriovorax marinus]|uniref:Uncharacterized protein n=1 Tax=Halobacteriovorax marinus TaxID=97084 RepID=A0A1Y5F466_9BACT|nr:hypothetical protein A9Q84_16180 [Halobacteriovorax marinus]
MKTRSFLLIDIFSTLYLAIPILTSWFVTITCIYYCKVLGILLSPLIFTLTLCLVILLLRLPLKKLRKSVFPIGFNKEYISWFLNLSLTRAVLSSGISNFLYSMSWSRYLIFRSLGAKVSYVSIFALNAEITDLPLITVGRGTLVGDHAKLSCHFFNKNKVILKPISIGENCTVLANTVVAPGTKASDNEIIGKGKST